MKNKINEASIKIDVNGLESSDFETLSRMLALAGQAESQGGMNPGFSDLPKMEPFDFDSAGEETQPIMNPMDAMAPESPADGAAGELDSAVDDLAGSVTDFGADDEVSLDLDGQPALELGSEEEVGDDFAADDEFDMGRMSSLAGIGGLGESLEADEDEAADGIMDDEESIENDEEDAGKDVIDESLLPDLSLDEDAEAVQENNDHRDFGDKHHVVDSKEHGPFRSEREAVHDAMKVTNGTEFEHFAIIPGKDGYYWRRNMQEGLDNEPDPCVVDMDGIENSRHAFKRQPGTALGDNPLKEGEFSPEGNEEDEEDDNIEDILESINSRYNSFMKGL